MTGKERARANGYIDGLKGSANHRLIYPPFDRFQYDEGRKDGEKCRL